MCSWTLLTAHLPLTLAQIIFAIWSQLIPRAKMKVEKAFWGWCKKACWGWCVRCFSLCWVTGVIFPGPSPAQSRHSPNTFSSLCSFELYLIWWLSLCNSFPVCSWSLWGTQISCCCTFFTFRPVFIYLFIEYIFRILFRNISSHAVDHPQKGGTAWKLSFSEPNLSFLKSQQVSNLKKTQK